MDEAVAARLNALNRAFYTATADRFEELRRGSWPGWKPLIPLLRPGLSVLDVGCGNGRFGQFVARNFVFESAQADAQAQGPRFRYHGVDSNADFLERARASLSDNLPNLTLTLELRDVLERPLDAGQFDLVVCFGVLHHIPGLAQRLNFMRMLAQRVAPGGNLVFACWRFYEYVRFRERIAPWPADLPAEPNDFLLDWRRGESALRYCHYVNDHEHAALVAATGFAEQQTYRADGETGDANCYSILRDKFEGIEEKG